jgi:3-oxoacyl-[acyl-carrier protein] reductase
MTDRTIALVTGGATGIGRAAVLKLAASGYDIALNYGSSQQAAEATAAEAQALGAQTLLLQCDVSDDAAVRQMMVRIDERFGRLDALINNAGTTASWKVKDLESLDLDAWDRVFAVNVRGLFQVTRAAVPLLRKGRNPAVVNLTKTLAWNLGPEIRVNAVAPGWMEGDWMERMLGEKYDTLMGQRAKMTPLKRCVTAEDVAETMHNLLTANRFVTGEIVVIDGGFTAST